MKWPLISGDHAVWLERVCDVQWECDMHAESYGAEAAHTSSVELDETYDAGADHSSSER